MNRRFEWNHPKSSLPGDIVQHWEGKNEHRTYANEQRTYALSGWRCGNPKRRKEVVSNFAQSSSVHGAAYVFSTGGRGTSLCFKIIYRVLFAVCLVSVISSIVSLLQDNFSKQSKFVITINRDIDAGYEEDPEYFPLYPRITICRRPSYRTDFTNASHLQLVEYVMLSLGYPFTPLTPSEVATAVQLIMHQLQMVEDLPSTAVDLQERLQRMEEQYQQLKKSEDYDLKSFVSDHSVNCSMFFSSCVVLVFPVDCCLLFSPVLTSNGRCFTVRDVSPVAKFLAGTPSIVFSVVIDLVSPPTSGHHSEAGFRVFLTDPSEEAPVHFDQFTGQDVVPDIATTIKANLIKTQRSALYTPWHGLWDTCPRWKYNASYDSDRYSLNICDLQQYFHMLREECGCESLLYYSGLPTARLCEPIDMYQCHIRAGFKSNATEYMTSCKLPCTAYTYRTESSYMGMGVGSNISRVEIMYNAKQFTYNEYRKATLSSLFSQIGGSLGLYLGASIFTLVEIITFTASWLWYRLAPAKVANTSNKVSPRPPFFTG